MDLEFGKPVSSKRVKTVRPTRGRSAGSRSSKFDRLDNAVLNMRIGQTLTIKVPDSTLRNGEPLTAEKFRAAMQQRISVKLRARQMEADEVDSRHEMSQDYRAVFIDDGEGGHDPDAIAIECVENTLTEEQENEFRKRMSKARKSRGQVEEEEEEEEEEEAPKPRRKKKTAKKVAKKKVSKRKQVEEEEDEDEDDFDDIDF